MTDPEPMSPTAELFGRARGGDRDALSSLYTRLAPRVRGLVAVRMGRSLIGMFDQDDIVQECLIEAMDRAETFEARSDGSLACWLARVVESRIRNAVRSTRARKRGSGEVSRRADLGLTTLSSVAPADAGPSPSQAAAGAGLDDDLERALLSIGQPYREVVYCHLVLGMSHHEVASSLELKNGDSARALFHKAVAKLRSRFEES